MAGVHSTTSREKRQKRNVAPMQLLLVLLDRRHKLPVSAILSAFRASRVEACEGTPPRSFMDTHPSSRFALSTSSDRARKPVSPSCVGARVPTFVPRFVYSRVLRLLALICFFCAPQDHTQTWGHKPRSPTRARRRTLQTLSDAAQCVRATGARTACAAQVIMAHSRLTLFLHVS